MVLGIWYIVYWYTVYAMWYLEGLGLRVDHGGEGDALARDERQELVVVQHLPRGVQCLSDTTYLSIIFRKSTSPPAAATRKGSVSIPHKVSVN